MVPPKAAAKYEILFNWQSLFQDVPDNVLTLQCNTERIISICVASLKIAEASPVHKDL